jgi:hypothetical protein
VTILKTCLKEIRWEIVDWIPLSRDMDQWQALVNTGVNLSTD